MELFGVTKTGRKNHPDQLSSQNLRLKNYLLGCCAVLLSPGLVEFNFQASDPCARREIPIKINPEWGFEIVAHYISPRDRLTGELVLRNRTGRTIYGVALSVDYLESRNSVLLTVQYLAAVKGAKNSLNSIRPFFLGRLNQPISPNENISLFGTNLMAVSVMPAQAKISQMLILFRDDAVIQFEPPTRSDAILVETPEQFDVAPGPRPKEIFLRVGIGADGQVEQQDLLGLQKNPDNHFLQRLRAHVGEWIFSPAFRGGFTVKSELVLRIRFRNLEAYPGPMECPLDSTLGRPEAFVNVDYLRIEGGRWTLMYGGYSASGRLIRPVVSSSRN